MTNITSLTLSELVKNIKDKKISSEETTKALLIEEKNLEI